MDIFPERANDLAEWRRELGHDSMIFPFLYWGIRFQGACALKVPLPDYPIAGVRTWQFVYGKGRLWEAAFVLNPDEYRAAYAATALREPDAQGAFDLHLDADARTLTYVKEPCAPSDIADPFFLHISPERTEDVQQSEVGYEDKDFDFRLNGAAFEGKCAGFVPLPDYPIASVRTGQFGDEGELWDAAFAFNPDEYRAAYTAAALREPDARGAFDIHLDADARTLTYVKDPCAPSDIAAPFFLHIFPERAEDIPRLGAAYESKDFDFRLNGAAFEGKCAGLVPLPDYPIAGVRTGQFGGAGELWETALAFNPDEHRAAYAAAASREPDARGAFDLHFDANARTLTYVKEPCAPPDVEHPFFLHVTPSRERDLPRESRQLGFEARDFDFRLRGAVFDGKCAAQAFLPEYSISRIRTGQWIRGEGEIWESTVEPRP